MKVLVTGHDGFVGSHLVPYLRDKGHDVVLFKDNLLAENISIEDVDVVIHMAALTSVHDSITNPDDFYDVNLFGTMAIVDAIKDRKIPMINFSSSSAADPLSNAYARSKFLAEQYVHHETVTLRPFNIYPGRDDMLIKKLEAGVVTSINGKHFRDWIHVNDVCALVERLLHNMTPWYGKRIDVGSGKSISVLAVARKYGYQGHVNYDPTPHERDETQADVEYITEILGSTPRSPFDDLASGL